MFTLQAQAQSRGIQIEATQPRIETPIAHGTYRALLIGNNRYDDQHGVWTPLKTAVSDARNVAETLQLRYGFTDVSVLENATRREVLLSLQTLSRRVMPKDSVLIYYAGHGFLDAETNQGYWVPVDAQGTDHTTFLRNSTIRDELSIIASRSQHTLLISDSCFSGSLLRRGTRGAAPAVDSQRYYEKVSAKKSVQIIAAGGVEYVDDDYKGSGHSPFTYFLLSELKHNEKLLLTASELSSNVEKAVANNVEQTPESGVLQGAGDELGEFIFINVEVHTKGVDKDKVKVRVNVIPDTNEGSESIEQEKSMPAQPSPGQDVKPYVIPLPTL
jgi:hypothetical protein